MKNSRIAAALALILLPATPAVAHAFTLQNASFDIPTPGTIVGGPVSTPAVCSGATGWYSASDGWTTWANSTSTQIVSWIATAPGGYTSNLVFAGGSADGLVQVVAPYGTITDVNRVSAWVYVLKGQVGVQFGDGGAAGGSFGTSSYTGQWEYISACGRPDMLNNEVTIYSSGPAIFYVDDASISLDSKACKICPHPATMTGKPLEVSCGTCEAKVCALDPYCCSKAWDATCVAEVASECYAGEP